MDYSYCEHFMECKGKHNWSKGSETIFMSVDESTSVMFPSDELFNRYIRSFIELQEFEGRVTLLNPQRFAGGWGIITWMNSQW